MEDLSYEKAKEENKNWKRMKNKASILFLTLPKENKKLYIDNKER